MNNCYILLKNKRGFIYIFFYVLEHRIYLFLYKKTQKKNFSKKIFPLGGLNPRTLDLKFTVLTTRPKELTFILMKMMEHNCKGILEKSQFSQQDVINFQKFFGILNISNIYYNFDFMCDSRSINF